MNSKLFLLITLTALGASQLNANGGGVAAGLVGGLALGTIASAATSHPRHVRTVEYVDHRPYHHRYVRHSRPYEQYEDVVYV